MKIIGVNHITYNNEIYSTKYYFKTNDDVKVGDVVLCKTSNGAALGVAVEVIDSITMDDFSKSDLYRYLTSGRCVELKDCKLLPDYKNIKLKKATYHFRKGIKKMNKKETIEFLESYKKQKALEKTKILTIAEMEENAQTAKSINMTSERVQGGKATLPEYIYAKILDMKDSLVREVYSNTIRLSILEEYIYKVAINNVLHANVLYYRFIMQYTFGQIESETNYSIVRLKQIFKEALESIYKILEPISLTEIEEKIKEQSFISREKLDEFYKKIYS